MTLARVKLSEKDASRPPYEGCIYVCVFEHVARGDVHVGGVTDTPSKYCYLMPHYDGIGWDIASIYEIPTTIWEMMHGEFQRYSIGAFGGIYRIYDDTIQSFIEKCVSSTIESFPNAWKTHPMSARTWEYGKDFEKYPDGLKEEKPVYIYKKSISQAERDAIMNTLRAADGGRRIVPCPHCHSQLQLQGGRRAETKCTACGENFVADTITYSSDDGTFGLHCKKCATFTMHRYKGGAYSFRTHSTAPSLTCTLCGFEYPPNEIPDPENFKYSP